jgi:hypothetical protein
MSLASQTEEKEPLPRARIRRRGVLLSEPMVEPSRGGGGVGGSGSRSSVSIEEAVNGGDEGAVMEGIGGGEGSRWPSASSL